MTTTSQTILDRARLLSPLNPSVLTDRAEILSRIRVEQQEMFTTLAGFTRDVFQRTAAISSNNAASARVFDLGDAFVAIPNAPVERVLLVTLTSGASSGSNINRVDVLEQTASVAPRYFARGKTLIEVGSEWGASGVATATLTYVYGATDIDPTGALTQNVTVPDAWTDLLVLPLAIYAHQKDPGRDPTERVNLERILGTWGDEQTPPSGRRGAFRAYCDNFHGVRMSERFLPPPVVTGRR